MNLFSFHFPILDANTNKVVAQEMHHIKADIWRNGEKLVQVKVKRVIQNISCNYFTRR